MASLPCAVPALPIVSKPETGEHKRRAAEKDVTNACSSYVKDVSRYAESEKDRWRWQCTETHTFLNWQWQLRHGHGIACDSGALDEVSLCRALPCEHMLLLRAPCSYCRPHRCVAWYLRVGRRRTSDAYHGACCLILTEVPKLASCAKHAVTSKRGHESDHCRKPGNWWVGQWTHENEQNVRTDKHEIETWTNWRDKRLVDG